MRINVREAEASFKILGTLEVHYCTMPQDYVAIKQDGSGLMVKIREFYKSETSTIELAVSAYEGLEFWKKIQGFCPDEDHWVKDVESANG